MTKRVISFLLIAVILVSIIPTEIYAEDPYTDFLAYLRSNGLPEFNSKSQEANFQTWKVYNVVAYDYPWGDREQSLITGRNEPRYLGYDVNGQKYTNTFFPNDERGTKSPLIWEYEEVSKATESWDNIKIKADQKSYMLNQDMGFIDENDPTGKKIITYSGLKVSGFLTTAKAKLLSWASFKNGFSVYTLHKGDNGRTYYATLYGPEMGGETTIDCKIEARGIYYIRANQTSVTVPVKAQAIGNLRGLYVKPEHIKEINVTFQDKPSTKAGVTSTETTKDLIFTREKKNTGDIVLGVGTHDIPLEASARMLSTFEDAYTAAATKTIRIIVEPPGDKPSVTATIEAEKTKQFTGTDVPILVKMTGQLNNFTDVSKISKVVFYINPIGLSGQYQRIERPAALVANTSYTFTVPASKLSGVSSYIQHFEGRVQYIFTDGSVVEQGFLWGPPLNQDPVKDKTEIYKLDPPIIDPPPTNMLPVPVISGDTTCVVGNSLFISGARSYDPDGYIVEYWWYFLDPDVENPITENKSRGSISYGARGKKRIILGVVDNDGAYVETMAWVDVTPPYPVPVINQQGTLKVNRKISVDALGSWSHPSYPVNHAFTTWSITPVNVIGGTAADIKYTGSLTAVAKDFIVKKPGKYSITLTVRNTAGMEGMNEKIIDVVPDEPPVADFTVIQQVLRDPSNYSKAQIMLQDQSRSIDLDEIIRRKWRYAYDSDNDGLFTDEVWKVFDDGNNKTPSLYVYDVGRYAFELEIEEGFGQPTIPELITTSDLLKANTLSKAAAEKVTEVVNVAPVADISANKIKKIDLVVATDYTGDKFAELGNKLAEYVNNSYNNYLDVKLNFVNGTKYVGRYVPADASGFTAVPDSANSKYEVARWGSLTEYSDNSYSYTYNGWPTITTYTGTFPSKIKQYREVSNNNGRGRLWLLENGELYFSGCMAYNSNDANAEKKPALKLTGVKSMSTTGQFVFILKNDGAVWCAGGEVNPTYFAQWGTIFNAPTHSGVIPGVADYSAYNGYGQPLTVVSFTGVQQVSGLSNVEYMWSNGFTLVYRTRDGKWYGMGQGLAAFGYPTAFNTIPTATKHIQVPSVTYERDFINDDYFYDFRSPVLLSHLTALDASVGGIKRIEPNKAYAVDGKIYNFSLTQNTIGGTYEYNEEQLAALPPHITYNYVGYYKQYFPLQIISSSFSSNLVNGETWDTKNNIVGQIGGGADASSSLDYRPSTIYDNYMLGMGYSLTGTSRERQDGGYSGSTYTGTWPSYPNIKYDYLMAPTPVHGGQINEFLPFAYKVEHTFSHWTATRQRYDEDMSAYPWYRDVFYNTRIVGYNGPLSVSPNVVGWKYYGVNLDNFPSMTFRPNAAKYVLYLDEKDSFKKISKDINKFIADNDISVKVSVNSAYLDGSVDTTKEINLRQFATATPKGTIYGQYAIDQMLQDITNENVVTRTGNKIYILKDEDNIEYFKLFADYENDIMQAERYKYDHDPYYFENSTGLASYSGQWLSALKSTFDKVGKLSLTYQAQDNPKNHPPFMNYWLWSNGTNQLEIYVHRRPIADFLAWGGLINAATKSLNITSYAYDLDHQSQANKGIVNTEWKWKFVNNDTVWKNGYPTTITQGNPIYVWQRVLDEEGVWSNPSMKLIEFEVLKNLPVAQFTITKNPINIDELLKIKDTSFAREGTLTRWHWIVVNADTGAIVQNSQFTNRNAGTGALAGFDANILTNYSSLGAGNYRVYLRVKDSNNLWSDEGTDASYNLNYFYSQSFTVVSPPVAQFNILKNPIKADESLRLRDTSYARMGILTNWHWVVVKLNTGATVQNAQFANNNNGSGALEGYDANVITDFNTLGVGSYRIYLRVKDSAGIWSDGGTDDSYNLNYFYSQLLTVEEPFMLKNFRVSIIRDLQLEGYYKNPVTGTYPDNPIYVNNMAIDGANFGVAALTKGYRFEFEIDSISFNENFDTVVIEPHFYTTDLFTRDALERDLYWEDSKHKIWKAGQGGHAAWNEITLTSTNRKITGSKTATWRGEYLIPGTSWAVPLGTSTTDAKTANLKRDIIVNFQIKGYKAGVLKFDYNVSQWSIERTNIKSPYLVGDVIKYSHSKSNLDDIKFKDNR
jgi:hypothetical protein